MGYAAVGTARTAKCDCRATRHGTIDGQLAIRRGRDVSVTVPERIIFFCI